MFFLPDVWKVVELHDGAVYGVRSKPGHLLLMLRAEMAEHNDGRSVWPKKQRAHEELKVIMVLGVSAFSSTTLNLFEII
jgi:hypothetical protein